MTSMRTGNSATEPRPFICTSGTEPMPKASAGRGSRPSPVTGSGPVPPSSGPLPIWSGAGIWSGPTDFGRTAAIRPISTRSYRAHRPEKRKRIAFPPREDYAFKRNRGWVHDEPTGRSHSSRETQGRGKPFPTASLRTSPAQTEGSSMHPWPAVRLSAWFPSGSECW